MPRQLHWNQLTGGLIAAAAVVSVALGILLFARVGALHGKKVTLYVVTDEAAGVLAGTEVWLAGDKAGIVTDVSFRSPTTDTLERLLVTTQFLTSALPYVRRDSYARIQPGGSLIGAPIVYISAGTAASPQLHDGDTVHTRPKVMIADLTQQIGTIAPELAALGAATGELNDKASRPLGTIGNYRTSGLPDLSDVSAGMSSLNARATRGNGTIGRAMRGSLRARASHAMAAADSIRTLMSSNRSSIGRFRRDTTLVTKASHVLAEVDTLRALLSDPIGTIAAAHPDSALDKQLDQTHVLLAALIKDAKSHPTRYIQF
jgi:phospholipid/cholesterol/gamma-HCH transport system substrate-binding protein